MSTPVDPNARTGLGAFGSGLIRGIGNALLPGQPFEQPNYGANRGLLDTLLLGKNETFNTRGEYVRVGGNVRTPGSRLTPINGQNTPGKPVTVNQWLQGPNAIQKQQKLWQYAQTGVRQMNWYKSNVVPVLQQRGMFAPAVTYSRHISTDSHPRSITYNKASRQGTFRATTSAPVPMQDTGSYTVAGNDGTATSAPVPMQDTGNYSAAGNDGTVPVPMQDTGSYTVAGNDGATTGAVMVPMQADDQGTGTYGVAGNMVG